QFTRESAERIANVVRAAELSGPVARPLMFERVDFVRNQKSFRIATFTGSWPTGTDKTVTFKYGATATAVATNLFFPITRTAAAGDCAIAKDGTAWFLIDVPFETATAVFASTTVLATVFGTGSTSLIRFIGTGSTQATTYITGVSASLNTASCAITVTAATATATSFSMAGTQTAISVSMAGTQTITVAGATFTSTFLRFRV
ncbi:MAG: hypothetical protein EBR82_58350, partial [Caulobacteraceae bacterium]|nr:hypothetical protein [Caulobacteraceae bacterium]